MSDYSGEILMFNNIQPQILCRIIEVFRIIQVSDYGGSTVFVLLMLSEDFDKIYFVTCQRTCIRNTFLMEKTVAMRRKTFVWRLPNFRLEWTQRNWWVQAGTKHRVFIWILEYLGIYVFIKSTAVQFHSLRDNQMI